MDLLCKDFKVSIDEKTGSVSDIISLKDKYSMNWVRRDYIWGNVEGFVTENIEKTQSGILVSKIDKNGNLKLMVERFIKNGKYCEEYIFENISNTEIVISQENIGIVFPYNCLFDKKENMLHTRCNSHVWCAEDICNIHSVKADGKEPYLIQKSVKGSFYGYGLLCDINAAPIASWDRGNIILYYCVDHS